MSSLSPFKFSMLKKLSESLVELDETPLFETPPAFSFEILEKNLKERLDVKDLSISKTTPEWIEKGDLSEIDQNDYLRFPVAISSLNEFLFVLMPKDSLSRIAGQSCGVDKLESPYLEGFLDFFLATILDSVEKSFGKTTGIGPRLLSQQNLTDGPFLRWRMAIKANSFPSLDLQFLLPKPFYHAWQKFYKQKPKEKFVLSPAALSSNVQLSLQAGSTQISYAEWMSLKRGDVIPLDVAMIVPKEPKGRVMMTLNGHPLFRARWKKGSLKILEASMHYEVESPMKQKKDESSSPKEETGGFIDPEIDEEQANFSEESEKPLPQMQEAPQTEHDEDQSEEEEEGEELKESGPSLALAARDQIPITVTVELGRLTITLAKLLELQTGNILKVDFEPERGVDLAVNGQIVGRGELVTIGDLVGVRVIELG